MSSVSLDCKVSGYVVAESHRLFLARKIREPTSHRRAAVLRFGFQSQSSPRAHSIDILYVYMLYYMLENNTVLFFYWYEVFRTLFEKTKMNHPRILIVDDDDTNREILRYALLQKACIVDIASDGLEGQSKIEQARLSGNPYDIIITDHQMPRMSGVGLINWIKMHCPTACILMSGAVEPDGHKADMFMKKPFELSDLFGSVSRFTDSSDTGG